MAKKELVHLKISPTIKQNIAWQSLLDDTHTYIVFGGGGGGGKTFLGCQWIIGQCVLYPDTKYFIAREKLKTLKQSTLLTFFKVAKSFYNLRRDIDYNYHQQDSYIEFSNGSRVDILELKFNPSDPLFEDLGSLEYTSGWIEEAGEIDVRAYDTIRTRIGRHLNDHFNLHPKLYITCNPKKNWLYTEFYKPYKEKKLPEDSVFIQALIDDNPFIESDYKRQLMDIKDITKRQRLLLGDWDYEDSKGVLLSYSEILDMFNMPIIKKPIKYMTVDVARFGADSSIQFFWNDWEVYKIKIHNGLSTTDLATTLDIDCKEEGIPRRCVCIDEGGIGGGVLDQFKGSMGFIGAAKPIESETARYDYMKKQNFNNLRSQCVYITAEKVKDRQVSIVTKDNVIREKLAEEMSQWILKNPDNDDDKIEIIGKDEMKLALGRSPDLADCLYMRAFFELKREYQAYVITKVQAISDFEEEQDFDPYSVL